MIVDEWAQPGLVIGVVAEKQKTLDKIQEALQMHNPEQIRRWCRGHMTHLMDGTRIYFILSSDPADVKSNRFDQIWACGYPPKQFWENVRMNDRVPEEWRVLYI